MVGEGRGGGGGVGVVGGPVVQVGGHAVEHLELEIILGDLFAGGEAHGLRDHARVVRGDGVVKAAGEQHLHQADIVAIDVFFAGEGDFVGLLVGAFAETNAAAVREQCLNVAFTAIEIGLDHSADRGSAGANAFDDVDGALGVDVALHVHAKEIFVAGGALDDGE